MVMIFFVNRIHPYNGCSIRTFKSVARHGSLANFKTKKKSNIISIIMMGILEFVSEERGYVL